MERASQTPPESIILREQDEQIIAACCRYQFLTIVDMAYLIGLPKSLNYVRKLASALAGNKDQELGHYLYRFALSQRNGGKGLRVFVPGVASRTLWPQDDGDGAIFKDPSTMQRYSYSFVSHNLSVARLCICAGLFCLCREHPEYYLVEERLSYDMARNPPRASLGADGQQISTPVIPDAWVYIERVSDGEGTALWFEVDNSTTYRQAFHRRLLARLKLITSEAYSEYFGTDAARLCFAVLGNEARMHTLSHWTWELLERQEQTDLASRFLFTSIEYEKLYGQIQTLFCEPVWRLPAPRSHEDCPRIALFPQDKEKTDDKSPFASDR